MRNAESRNGTVHHSRTQSRNRSLESHVIRKAVTRGSEGGGWKSAQLGNSLAAYPTHAGICAGGGRVTALPTATAGMSLSKEFTI